MKLFYFRFKLEFPCWHLANLMKILEMSLQRQVNCKTNQQTNMFINMIYTSLAAPMINLFYIILQTFIFSLSDYI